MSLLSETLALIRVVPGRGCRGLTRWSRDQHAPFDLAGDGTGPAVCRLCKVSWPCDDWIRFDSQLRAN